MEKIKQQVYNIIQHSQNIEDPQVDALLDNWQTNKAKFLEAFGGPIYKVGFVEMHLTAEGKQRRVDDFIDRVIRIYNNLDLANFIESNADSFFDNIVIYSPNKDIPAGMKLLKAFKYYCDSEIELKDLQNEASRLIQEDKLNGNLYFSVHPVDFLSSSENDCNWRSCHSLDGEYRGGNLSYMQDSSTFMAYITSSNESYLPHFPHSVPWNSKKWRMLLHISEDWDFMFAGRQYPCELGSALSEVSQALKQLPAFDKLATSRFGAWQEWIWHDDIIKHPRLTDKYLILQEELVPMRRIVNDAAFSLHYNDLLYSSYYEPKYIYNDYMRIKENKYPKVLIGSSVRCLECGEQNIEYTELMRCSECNAKYTEQDDDSYGTCVCCGSHWAWDDFVYVRDAIEVCPVCAERETYMCPRCDVLIFNEDKVFDTYTEEYYCNECMSEMTLERK